MKITMPLRVWNEALDPERTNAQTRLGLSTPRFFKVGRGHQVIYDDVAIETASKLADYLVEWGGEMVPRYKRQEQERFIACVKAGETLRHRIGQRV